MAQKPPDKSEAVLFVLLTPSKSSVLATRPPLLRPRVIFDSAFEKRVGASFFPALYHRQHHAVFCLSKISRKSSTPSCPPSVSVSADCMFRTDRNFIVYLSDLHRCLQVQTQSIVTHIVLKCSLFNVLCFCHCFTLF